MKLATRIMMLVAFITLLMGVFAIVLSGPVIKQGFRAMDAEWIESLSASLAEGIAHDTINGNATRARQILETVVLRNKELDYAYVVDFDQHLFVHTFRDGFPKKLFDLVSANKAHQFDHHHDDQAHVNTTTQQHMHSEKLHLDGADVTDISYPIIEGMSARLHLGLNDKADEALVRAIDQKLVMIIFSLGLFGILIAFPVSRKLTRPLERFGQLMQDYGHDKLEGQVEFPQGSSEISNLGVAFNKMIESRSRAKDALGDISELNNKIINESPIGLAIYDHSGQCIAANASAAEMIGASREQVLAQNYNDLDSWKKSGLLDAANESIQLQEKQRHEFELVTTFDKQAFYDCLFVPFVLRGEQRLLLMLDDITERKRAVTELNKYRYQLEELVEERTRELQNAHDELVRKERLATLGQLTATVSHELRNPLGAMRPSLYLIGKKIDKEDEHIQKAIERVDRNIDRCDHIIDELLDFTRITELNRQTTRVDEWLESVIDEQEIPEGILLEKGFFLKDVELAIDADRLRRAIINVVDNACHAMMDDKSQVTDKKNARLDIKTRDNNERIEIVVTDTGIGMTKDVLEKIFEPLYSTKGFGVGLGMPTVKQIMEQHGGGIEIDTEEDKGTSVTLWLPCVQSDEVAA